MTKARLRKADGGKLREHGISKKLRIENHSFHVWDYIK